MRLHVKEVRAKSEASLTSLKPNLPPSLERSRQANEEKGASAWVTALPLTRHGLALHKGSFRDALCLRYGWPLPYMPEKCVCDAPFNANHALVCKFGGYTTIRHNEIRDLTASLMREVCNNVSTEPPLQALTGEALPRSSNQQNEARLDVRARGFWNCGTDAFFDVRVFHPQADSYRSSSLPSLYRRHEKEKKRQYGQRVIDVEHGSFTPLVFTTAGGMGREASAVYKRLAQLIAEKLAEPYSSVIGWIRCRLSFSLLRSSLLCIRGSRRKFDSSFSGMDPSFLEIAVAESRLH